MTQSRNKYLSREQRSRVRDLFMREWDPIGVQGIPEAADEYDSYIGQAFAMLMDDHATAAAIEAYLLKIATEHMGIGANDDLIARCARTASQLIALRPAFEKEHKQLN